MTTKDSADGSALLQPWWRRCFPAARALPLRQRMVAAALGVACAIILFVAAVPPAHSTVATPGAGSSVSYLLLDALRMLTGVAAADVDPAQPRPRPSGGIRN